MSELIDKINNIFSDDSENQTIKVCDAKTGICYIKNGDGLIERQIINKKLIVEDGRELLREETPISNSRKTFLI